MSFSNGEARVAVLVDCDNVPPGILDHALRVSAQFGRIVLRRGYGNFATLSSKWQEVLVNQAFTPCLQYQYAAKKNTADIALALDAMEAMFDKRAEVFCLVTSDSDFAYLCRKLREHGTTVYIVGESKTPPALRNASDQFFKWEPPVPPVKESEDAAKKPPAEAAPAAKLEPAVKPESPKQDAIEPSGKLRPYFVVEAVSLLAGDTSEGKIGLGALGQYLKRTDPAFSPKTYGHSGLLAMVQAYKRLKVTEEKNSHWVSLAPAPKK